MNDDRFEVTGQLHEVDRIHLAQATLCEDTQTENRGYVVCTESGLKYSGHRMAVLHIARNIDAENVSIRIEHDYDSTGYIISSGPPPDSLTIYRFNRNAYVSRMDRKEIPLRIQKIVSAMSL